MDDVDCAVIFELDLDLRLDLDSVFFWLDFDREDLLSDLELVLLAFDFDDLELELELLLLLDRDLLLLEELASWACSPFDLQA